MTPLIETRPPGTSATPKAPVTPKAPEAKRIAEAPKPTKPVPAKGVDSVPDSFEKSDAEAVKSASDVIKSSPKVAASDEHAKHVAAVRKDLAAKKLPTSAKGVAVIIVAEDVASHGAAITRAVAGPVGLAKDAQVHLRKSGNHQDKYLATHPYATEFTTNKGTITVKDFAKLGVAKAEAAMYAAREEIKTLNKELPADGKTRIASISWGQSVNRIATEQAASLGLSDPALRSKLYELKMKDKSVDINDPDKIATARSLVAVDIMNEMNKLRAEPANAQKFAALKTDLETELATAQEKGLLVFNAAGNDRDIAKMLGDESRSTNFFDDVKGLVSVGAADLKTAKSGADDAMWEGSSTGKNIKVAAPGVNLPIGDGGAKETGTSFATPYMASVAALMVAANPKITPAQIVEILDSGKVTKDLAGGTDGKGLIDPVKAVAAAKALAAA